MNEVIATSSPVILCDRAGDPLDGLREKAKHAYRGEIASGWDFACYAAEIVRESRWLTWGFTNAKAWLKEDYPHMHPTNFSHYHLAGKWMLELPEAEQHAWSQMPVWQCIKALPALADPATRQRLLEKMLDGASENEVRKELVAAKPDLHLEAEWRTITLRVSLPVYEIYEHAQRLARFMAGQDSPTDEHLLEAMAQALLGEWAERSKESTDLFDTIMAGEYRCKECGSWNAAMLHRHHVIPRSHQGHEGPLVLLCAPCHQKLHLNLEGNWRDYAQKWGFDVAGA